ncbi:MAG: O-antigen ligase family protein [Pseudomonadota bacterium]|nr:O-antigen ligase family protein [Pseudomonadota bacterium]
MPRRGSADRSRLAFYLLLCWIVLLPWPLGANRDWIWPWYSAVLLLIAAHSAWTVDVAARWRMAHPGLRLALLSLLLLGLLDLLRAIIALPSDDAVWRTADPDAGILGALRSSTLCALVFTSMLLLSSRRRVRWLLVSMLASGVAVALLALTLTLTGLTLPWLGHRLGGSEFATGTYINRNHFAGMLELAGAVGFGLLASGLRATERADSWREWVRRIGHAMLGSRFAVRAALAVMVVALVMTRSRMGNAAFFIGLTAAGVASLIWWRPLPRILIWLLVSIVAIDVLVLGAWVGVDKLAERVAETHLVAVSPERVSGSDLTSQPATNQSTPAEPDDAERWVVARAGLRLWRERPWFGHGPGSFRLLFPAVKPESVGLFYEHAHNDYVQTLVERGLFGLVLFLIATASLLFAALQALRLRGDSLARGLALATIAASVAFGLHSLVDFNLQIPANLFWFQVCLLLGALSHALPVPRPVDRRTSRRITDHDAQHD